MTYSDSIASATASNGPLIEAVRELYDETVAEADSSEAARNLSGFMRILMEVDKQSEEE